MKNPHYVEALLRPPIELWTTIVCIVVILVLIFKPGVMMLAPSIALLVVTIPAVLGIIRFRQGIYVLRYQRNLKSLPEYKLPNTKVPVSDNWLFFGRGFEWGQRHTQRLWDTRANGAERFVEPGKLFKWARKKEIEWEKKLILHYFALLLRKRVWYNPLSPYLPLGGDPKIHGVELNSNYVIVPLEQTNGHILVVGTTRIGKTRLAELLITQDIHRGDIVIIIDPKGDGQMLMRAYAEAKRAGREKDFYIFHLGYPNISSRYNVIGSFDRLTEVPTRLTAQQSNEGDAASFKQFGWRFINIVAQTDHALGRKPSVESIRRGLENMDELLIEYCAHWLPEQDPDWEQQVQSLVSAIDERNIPSYLRGRNHRVIGLMRYLDASNLGNNVLSGLRSAVKYEKTFYGKIIANALPFLDKITAGKLLELISPNYDDSKANPILDWNNIIRTKGIVYIGLDGLAEPEVAAAVGGIILNDLTSKAGYLYKYGAGVGATGVPIDPRRIALHADELHQLIGPMFIPMVNQCGGAGISVTAYTQTIPDIEAKLGKPAMALQTLGNFNTMVMFRVRDPSTAEYLCNQLPEVNVSTTIHLSGVNDSSDLGSGKHFTSNTQDREGQRTTPLITTANIMSLPVGQAFMWSNGKVQQFRIPQPDASADEGVPTEIREVAKDMMKKYRTGDYWWELASAGFLQSELETEEIA